MVNGYEIIQAGKHAKCDKEKLYNFVDTLFSDIEKQKDPDKYIQAQAKYILACDVLCLAGKMPGYLKHYKEMSGK